MRRDQPLSPSLGPLIQDFFCRRLIEQRNASPRTIAAYRDTFRLLIRFLAEKLGKRLGELVIGDLDATCVLRFLNHLESERKNTIRTRNARLAAIRSFLKYASWREPLALPTAQRTLAIPMKRFDRPLMGFLSREEVLAIQDAPSACTPSGQRDRVMLALMYNTGARVSEVAALRVGDVTLDQTAAVALRGKGRKARTVPLWKSTAALLKMWLRRLDKNPDAPLLPSSMGRHMSRSGIESRLKLAVRAAAIKEPRLTASGRRISPHTLRHTTAMHLLQSGIDTTVIALWLGHESPTTTHGYVEADLAMKERALGKLEAPRHRKLRYQPNEKILQFLESL